MPIVPCQRESQRCVHCCQTPNEITLDHVFPASWYPDTTPEDVQRWTVPCCRPCNQTLGKIEQEVFTRLALCVDSQTVAASGLSARAMRSMGIGVEGLSRKESRYRSALKKKILGSMRRAMPGEETLAGAEAHSELPRVVIPVPARQLDELAKKIVRGSEYVLAKQIVESPYEVAVYFVYRNKVPDQIARTFELPSTQREFLGLVSA